MLHVMALSYKMSRTADKRQMQKPMKTEPVVAPLISGRRTQNMTEFVATVIIRLYWSVEKSTRGTITVIIRY